MNEVKQTITVAGICGVHNFDKSGFKAASEFAKYIKSTIKVENVISATVIPYDAICFGTLETQGWLKKRYVPGCWDHDPSGIEWEVIGDIVFSDEYGHRYKQGDVISWEK